MRPTTLSPSEFLIWQQHLASLLLLAAPVDRDLREAAEVFVDRTPLNVEQHNVALDLLNQMQER